MDNNQHIKVTLSILLEHSLATHPPCSTKMNQISPHQTKSWATTPKTRPKTPNHKRKAAIKKRKMRRLIIQKEEKKKKTKKWITRMWMVWMRMDRCSNLTLIRIIISKSWVNWRILKDLKNSKLELMMNRSRTLLSSFSINQVNRGSVLCRISRKVWLFNWRSNFKRLRNS